jgi:hypothetical protein
MRKLITIFSILVFLPLLVFSQRGKDIMKSYFAEVRAGKYNAIPKTFALPENSKETLKDISVYLGDTTTAVRLKAYSVVQLVGDNSRDKSIRENAVVKLVNGLKDKDSGVAGSAAEYLANFFRSDFNKSATDSVSALARRGSSHKAKLYKLAGFIQINSLQELLRGVVQNGDADRIDRWSALLALSRLGDAYAIEDVMRRARKLPVKDEVVYQIFPDLVYTRNKVAIDYLVEVLNSDTNKCASANAESTASIPCAYRVMEMLAPAIDGYPVKLHASGDIVSTDYAASLQEVRRFFAENKDYKINNERY